MSQDLCINNNPATIVGVHAGAIGMTDVTHLGWFDMASDGKYSKLSLSWKTYNKRRRTSFAMLEWSIEHNKNT